ncbi:potassium-transporting ATPase subunit C [Leptospira sp. 'Mane']|uniref:potassium-transporting ATPase subunit C n=1 Tax=Leptospira sp. 'Mane' TaxID=3387407 RepID=UPI00398AC183
MNHENSQSDLGIGIRFLIISILVLGFIYPSLITMIGSEIFPHLSEGSLIRDGKGEVRGSYLLAQQRNSGIYFISRPSAGDYSALPSLASQLAPSSLDLHSKAEERKLVLVSKNIDWKQCQELLFASGSGLDPHITTDCAIAQVDYIAGNRNLQKKDLDLVINQVREGSVIGIFGRDRVNVMLLNLYLDGLLSLK